jgi:NAD(P)-dependent dehydrogenase (short-subunit alcohol dehydrogenase family)
MGRHLVGGIRGPGYRAGRIGTARDVAAAVRYLVGSSLVTGSIMPVDGGLTVA